mgnify:CR=1 FL=1
MKKFSPKFIDMMIGVVLGLGFQWWPALTQPWQYAAFIFSYLDIVDFWIDYEPSLKKFPPKREVDVLLDVGIIFCLFLYTYATQLTIAYFLTAFIALRVFDFFWLLSSKREYLPTGTDKTFVDTWLWIDTVEAGGTAALIALTSLTSVLAPLAILVIFIVFRATMRVIASWRYKRTYFV